MFDPAPRTLNGRQYHQLSFVENRPEAAVTWQSFLVGVAEQQGTGEMIGLLDAAAVAVGLKGFSSFSHAGFR